MPIDLLTDHWFQRQPLSIACRRLKGVWYRGMFEHSSSVATLEHWFDPRRLRRASKLPLFLVTRAGSAFLFKDKKALPAFLRTL